MKNIEIAVMGPVEQWLTGEGYINIRKIPGRGYCAVRPSLFGYALAWNISLSRDSIHRRVTFNSKEEAITALNNWDGSDPIPSPNNERPYLQVLRAAIEPLAYREG